MPTTYPGQGATVSGQLITVDRLLNNPVLIYRTLRGLVEQRLIGDKLLTGRVDLTGSGSAIFEVSEGIFSDLLAERTAALAEYPLTPDTPGTPSSVTTDKWALATEISDELVARNRMDIATRKLIKLANRIAFQFDAVTLSAIASAVTQTSPAAAAWNTGSADPFLDIMVAGSVPDSLNQGYEIDVLALTPVLFARAVAAAKVIERAPREDSNSLLITGRMIKIAGLTFLKTTNMPPSTSVLAVDSTQLGSIAYEELGGGYTGAARDGVQSKRFRKEGNDGWRIQGRRVAAPMVQEPGAGVKITGV